MKLTELISETYREDLEASIAKKVKRLNDMADENERIIAKNKRTIKALNKPATSRPETRVHKE